MSREEEKTGGKTKERKSVHRRKTKADSGKTLKYTQMGHWWPHLLQLGVCVWSVSSLKDFR